MPDFQQRKSPGAEIQLTGAESWQLSIPPAPEGAYRLAQLDDYLHLRRKDFLWQAPAVLELDARVLKADFKGTWGFGWWNDPFGMGIGVKGTARRMPTLPNAIWFFYASPPNYLSLRDDLPAQGFLAATFSSPHIPLPLLAGGIPALPLLGFKRSARWLRRMGRKFVQQDAVLLDLDQTVWRNYRLEWQAGRAVFYVDRQPVFATSISPLGKLGLVLWIDNQYAAFTPDGRLAFGTLPNDETAWLELKNIQASEGGRVRSDSLQK